MFNDNPNFYPTPDNLVEKMLNKIKNLHKKHYILEPSAGSGNIIDYYKKYYRNKCDRYIRDDEPVEKHITFNCIELDERLINILRGKNLNVICDNFLDFQPNRFYDIIIANFPFSQGAEHLLKAIDIQERIGGEIVCLVNAETLKNSYSNNRKHLMQLLEKYNADIEYIQNAFLNSERPTDVEVALIHLFIPMKNTETMFEREFKRDNPEINIDNINSLTTNRNKLDQLIFECELIKKSGIKLFEEKMRIDKLLEGMGLKSELSICKNKYSSDEITINQFIDNINLKYWNKFINETDFKDRLPSKLRNTFVCNMERQKNICFNAENVQYFYEELVKSIPKSYEETCSAVFDEITMKHCYTETSWNKTIHYYNGWKSNNCYKINKKVIIPCYTNGWYTNIPNSLLDLNIIFENLSGRKNKLNETELRQKLHRNEKKIDFGFFLVDSYKKGTCHVHFKDKDLLDRFNILVGKGKNALPPDFGEKPYNSMTDEERRVTEEFGLNVEGYNKLTLQSNNKDYLRLMA